MEFGGVDYMPEAYSLRGVHYLTRLLARPIVKVRRHYVGIDIRKISDN